MQRSTRMKKEIQMLTESPPHGICCWCEDSINSLEAKIIGGDGTPYSGGIFKLDIQVPEKYPFEPPKVRFLTPIYHPNIDPEGRICLDTLKMPPKGAWKPILNISTVLVSIQLLMAQPNPEDPLMTDISNEFRYNRALYEMNAKQWTKKYASQQLCGDLSSNAKENLEQLIAQDTNGPSNGTDKPQQESMSQVPPSKYVVKQDTGSRLQSSKAADKQDTGLQLQSSKAADKQDTGLQLQSSKAADKQHTGLQLQPSKAADKQDTGLQLQPSKAADKQHTGLQLQSSKAADKQDTGLQLQPSKAADKQDTGLQLQSSKAADKQDTGLQLQSSKAADKQDTGLQLQPSKAADKQDTGLQLQSSKAADKQHTGLQLQSSKAADKPKQESASRLPRSKAANTQQGTGQQLFKDPQDKALEKKRSLPMDDLTNKHVKTS